MGSIATEVRRSKSRPHLLLNPAINSLFVAAEDERVLTALREAQLDMAAVTRAEHITYAQPAAQTNGAVSLGGGVWLTIQP